MEWQGGEQGKHSGRIRILSLAHFLGGIRVQLPYLTPAENLYHFHPLDLFSDEASCGVFVRDGNIENRMFYNVQGEDEVFDLQLEFYGYLLLANMARGYFYWPAYISELIDGTTSPESESFKANMPDTFPDFALAEFNAKFESLRVR